MEFFCMTALHINLFTIVAPLFSVWVLCQVKLQQGPVQCPREWERCGTQDELYPLNTWSHAEAWSFLPHYTGPRKRLPLASCWMESQIPFSDLHLPPVAKMPRRNGSAVLWIASLPVLLQGLGDEDSCALIPLCKSAPANLYLNSITDNMPMANPQLHHLPLVLPHCTYCLF